MIELRRGITVLWLFAVVVGADGCASLPTGRFDSLAAASHLILQGSKNTYTRIETLERGYMVFNPVPGKLAPGTFRPTIIDDNGKTHDFDYAPRLRFRESALEVLATYADTLQAFVKKDYQGDLDKAVQELDASIGNLASHVTKSADAKAAAGIIATAIDGLGKALIESKRKQALKEAMDKAQGGVAKLAGLIADDNSEIASAVVLMRGGILRVANEVRPPEHSIARLRFDGQIALVVSETAEILASLESLNAAVSSIPRAHAEIRRSLEDEGTALSQLQALLAEAKQLNTFYRSLK
jgi:hypothetical protein